MGKLKKRNKPCSRAEDCCMYDPCQRSEMKKAAKKAEKKAKKDKKDKKDKKKKKKKSD